MSERNVRARLIRTRTAPGTPVLTVPLVIWWRGSRFRVRDETGRPYAELVGDVTEPRGFGIVPRTMEGFMDATTGHPLPPGRSHTELYGDLSSPDGVVDEPWEDPWEVDAEKISPVAGQLFAADLGGLTPTGHAALLGRDCVEYLTSLEGVDNGFAFRSEVRRLVAGPYVLSREVIDEAAGMRSLVEVVALDEGVVTDEDVTPPPGAG